MNKKEQKPEKTLEYKVQKSMESFSFNPPLNLIEEGEWLSPVTCFKATNSLFNITDEKISFQLLHQVIGIPTMVTNLLASEIVC